MEIRFTRMIPVLASLDIHKTEAFYKEKLGFVVLNNYGNYLVMQRADCILHFVACNDRYIAENTSCYIYLEGIDELYAEYEAAGVVHANGKLEDKFYRQREFSILDGDGNLIKFGQAI